MRFFCLPLTLWRPAIGVEIVEGYDGGLYEQDILGPCRASYLGVRIPMFVVRWFL